MRLTDNNDLILTTLVFGALILGIVILLGGTVVRIAEVVALGVS